MTDAAAVAADAYVFGYPLVLMNRMRLWMTAVRTPDAVSMHAPLNRFAHARELPEATAGRRAGPHPGTLRSHAWLDVGPAPVVLTVPGTHGRFYALSLVDLWTNVFASVGARATGTGSGAYAVGGPGWSGAVLPPGTVPIAAPTRIVRITGSTQVDADGGSCGAHAVQDAYQLEPLAGPDTRSGGPAATVPAASAAREPPVVQVERMGADAFLTELAALMRENPPRLEDRPTLERMRRLGLLEQGDLGWHRLGRGVQRAVAEGFARGLDRVVASAEAPPGDPVGDWQVAFRLGQFGTDYLGRAGAACAGLEAGPAADELTALVKADADGRALGGQHRYTLTFPAGGLPPVHGFWTITTYDARQAFVDNPTERYSIGDWNDLVLEADGALSIGIGHRDPGDRVANWLPAPPGAFILLLRLCWPQGEALDRYWTPPAVERVGE